MMAALERRLLTEFNVRFSADDNRIRCFPHVVNIAVQTALKSLSSSSPDPDPLSPDSPTPVHISPFDISSISDAAYALALSMDPVGRARIAAVWCRASEFRRVQWLQTIKNGNEAKDWPDSSDLVLRVVQLLRDVDTRWSSTFGMVDRVLELAPAVTRFMLKNNAPADIMLTQEDFAVLYDIREFLSVPHLVQQQLSFEQTPTLPQVLPAYELLLQMLQDLQVTLPRISAAIEEAARKIEQYMEVEHRKPIYTVSIGMFPSE
ncbi:hypothetical protein OF83DRAFT_1071370 [Amylostereum chailletii]|nr:hypothetical protein OF83DRAFT_1071370 [Amylostereum chailletii]